MTIRSDNYRVTINFGGDSSLSWSDIKPKEVEHLLKMVEEQGPPFRLWGSLINPEHVAYVNTYRPMLRCPECDTNSSLSRKKDCTLPDYH